MKSPWLRKLVLPLALACAGAQVGPGGALIASALVLGLHAGDHAHSLTIQSDRGHRDLVLSHEDGHAEQAAGASGDHAGPTPERHHVFHLTEDDARSAARRAHLTPVAAVATAPACWKVSVSTCLPRHSARPRARSADFLRTVVLQL